MFILRVKAASIFASQEMKKNLEDLRDFFDKVKKTQKKPQKLIGSSPTNKNSL